MRTIALFITTSTLLIAAAPVTRAQTGALVCHGAQKPREVAELLFGRDIGERLGVSESAWDRFVASEMTPRFPNGLTIIDAIGQWRDRSSGKIVHEPSKKVEIVLPGDSDDEARLEAVVTAYKRAFHQQAVRVIVRGVCVAY